MSKHLIITTSELDATRVRDALAAHFTDHPGNHRVEVNGPITWRVVLVNYPPTLTKEQEAAQRGFAQGYLKCLSYLKWLQLGLGR